MERQKQVVHFQARKGITKAQSNEHLRDWTEKGWTKANENGRIDRSRQHLNFEIVRGGTIQPVDRSRSIPKMFAQRLKELGLTDPNEGLDEPRYRTMADFVISGSHDLLHSLAFADQEVRMDFTEANGGIEDPEHRGVNAHLERKPEIERWAMDMYDVLKARFGEENILSFVVHCDERTPHVHAVVLPLMDGRIAYKKVFCGEDKYEYSRRTSELHDLFAAVNGKWGLERGDSVTVTHTRHRSSEEYRRDLVGQCSTLEKEVDEKSATLKDLKREVFRAQIRVKSLTTMVANLERDRDVIERQLDIIHQSLSDGTVDENGRYGAERKESALKKKMEDILRKLSDKQEKLKAADEKLEELKDRMAEAMALNEKLTAEIRRNSAEISDATMHKACSEALWLVLRDFAGSMKKMQPESASLFEDTLLMDLSQRGINIIACAALLFGGMVDQATTFAENCGGGGGGTGGSWGRDPDEDEREWMRRCLAQSRRMMKPSGQHVRR